MSKLTLTIEFNLISTEKAEATDIDILKIDEKSDVPVNSELMLPILLLLLEKTSKNCERRNKGDEDKMNTIKKIRDFLKYIFADSAISLKK